MFKQNSVTRLLALIVCMNACFTIAEENPGDCSSQSPPEVHCGNSPTSTFDPQGRLWVAFIDADFVYVSHSDDQGKTFSTAVKVNTKSEEIYGKGENRPKLAIGLQGEIYVSWTQKTGGRFNGDIRFSRSLDQGQHFEPVKTVNDDKLKTSHRFDNLLVGSDGSLYLVWLDKRDLVKASEKGDLYRGAAIYYAVSTDRGHTFSRNRKISDHSCQCCRIAISETSKGAAIFWRHVFEANIRDHGFAVLGKDGLLASTRRVTFDGWALDACPHHGPAITTGKAGGGEDENVFFHLAWFTGGDGSRGIYFATYDLENNTLINKRSMATSASASHPHIQTFDNRLWMVWKAFDGQETGIYLAVSENSGKDWLPTTKIAATTTASDYPFLATSDDNLYLSWHTNDKGLQIIPVSSLRSGESP